MNDQKDIIQIFYELLPPQAQDKVSSFAWTKDVASIGLKYGLTDPEVEILKNEVLYVLLAIEDTDQMLKSIQNELQLSSEISLKIAKDIDTMILYDVKAIIAETIQNTTKGIADERTHPSKEGTQVIHDEIAVPAYVKVETKPEAKPEIKPNNVPDNLPVLEEEREVAVQRINTPNSILNKQLEVPVAHPYEKPRPVAAPTPMQSKVPTSNNPLQTFAKTSLVPPVTQEMNKPNGPSIVEARLGGSFNMPQEEMVIPAHPQTAAPAAPAPAPKIDPYREPIE